MSDPPKLPSYHVPVMLVESVDGLNVRRGGIYVDVTFGGGGHSKEILRRLNGTGHLYSFDQDEDAVDNISRIGADGASNFTFVRSNFRFLQNWMSYYGVDHIDGLLADLGVSSHHFDDAGRGFSFRYGDAPLDMRMNRNAHETAANLLNMADAQRLADVLYLYGELRNSRQLAAAIVKARPLSTSADLVRAVEPAMGKQRAKKDIARVFQALRIEVNHEMTALRQMLASATRLLAQGGRLSVITYHSLEDRIVKNVMRTGNAEGLVKQDFYGRVESPLVMTTGKVIVPTAEELAQNPRSRSAKLRIAEKK